MSTTTITATSSEVRTSTETPFLTMSPAELEYRNHHFVKTGKVLFTKMELSEDKLTRKITIIFLNEDTRLDYRNDPVITDFRLRKKKYNKSNGISVDFEFEVD
jgi:hypothetical protein